MTLKKSLLILIHCWIKHRKLKVWSNYSHGVGMFLVCSLWISEVAQSCPTLCHPMDCSLPGFFIHGIFQTRVLEWVSISFSRGSSRHKDRTQVSCIAGRCFTTTWATCTGQILLFHMIFIVMSTFPLFSVFLPLRWLNRIKWNTTSSSKFDT